MHKVTSNVCVMKRLSIILAAFFIGIVVVNAQQHPTVTPTDIRGIVLIKSGLSTGDISRESYSYQSFHSDDFSGIRAILHSSADIDSFTHAVNSLDILPATYNPYSNGVDFFRTPDASRLHNFPSYWHNPTGYAMVYYKNGTLPQLIWFSMGRVESEANTTVPSYGLDKTLMTLAEKNKCTLSQISDTIKSWNSEPIDCSSVEKIVMYAKKQDECTTNFSRQAFIDLIGNYACGRKVFMDEGSIRQIITNLSELTYKRTLDYNTLSTVVRCHIGKDGDLMWQNESAPVMGQMLIFYRGQSFPEIIWFTTEAIERGYFQFQQSDFFRDILKNITR